MGGRGREGSDDVKFSKYFSPAGQLLIKREAPCCVRCGRRLWSPIYRGDWPQYDADTGERLGYIPFHRASGLGAECYQWAPCAKRAAEKGATKDG